MQNLFRIQSLQMLTSQKLATSPPQPQQPQVTEPENPASPVKPQAKLSDVRELLDDVYSTVQAYTGEEQKVSFTDLQLSLAKCFARKLSSD